MEIDAFEGSGKKIQIDESDKYVLKDFMEGNITFKLHANNPIPYGDFY